MFFDYAEENATVLLPRWRHLKWSAAPGPEWQAFGFTSQHAEELRSLEEIHVQRASDAAVPLFRVTVPDRRLEQLLDSSTSEVRPLTAADELVIEENLVVLHNRRSAAMGGRKFGATAFGLSYYAADLLSRASYRQIQSACRKGARLAEFAPRCGYLRNAGHNFQLTQKQRTALAITSSTLMGAIL